MSEIGITADAQPIDDFATIPDVPIQAESNRVNPNQVASGVTRGTQTYMNTDGSYMTMGLIPNTTNFGIAFFTAAGKLISKSTSTVDYKYDTLGNLIFKNDGQTQYIYDKTTGKNVVQIGKLPDGSYGWAVAKSGYNVSDAIS
jgi:hypothetical protein